MSVLDKLVLEAVNKMESRVDEDIVPDEDNEEIQREAYRKMYAVEPLPVELEGKPHLSLFIKHNDVPIKHAYIATPDELHDFVTKFWRDMNYVEDSFENYEIEYHDCSVPMRRIFSDSGQFLYYVCRHLQHIAECWEEEMRMDGDKEGIIELNKEIMIIYRYENETYPTRLFLDGKEICAPSRNFQLEDVYTNLLRKTTVGPYNISYNIGTRIIDECVCETVKDVFDLIFFELGFMFDSSWNEIIAHVVYGQRLPEEKGPDWFEELYRVQG